MRIGIVVSEMHWDITGRMLEIAEEAAQELGVETEVRKVPGTFEIPLSAKRLLDFGVDGVVTLGVVMQGGTDHDVVIANTVSRKLMSLSIKYGKPVSLGINGPRITREQAFERVGRAKEAVRACVSMIERKK